MSVIDGDHFGFYAPKNPAHRFFFTNTISYPKQSANPTEQRIMALEPTII